MSILKNFTKDLISNISQILVVVILLPSVCWLLALFNTNTAKDLITNILSQIAFIDIITDVMTIYINCGGMTSFADASHMYDNLFAQVNNLGTAIFQALFVAEVVRLFQVLGEIRKLRGMPILSSVVGALIGTILLYFIKDFLVLALIFLFVLTCVLDIIYVEEITKTPLQLLTKCLKVLLKLIVTAISTIFITCFIVVCMAIWKGNGSINYTLAYTLFIILPILIIITLFISHYLLDKKITLL